MAVYTSLDDAQLRTLLAIYPGCGDVQAVEGVAAGSINSIFRVTTSTGVFYVRVSEGQTLLELGKERDLLSHLHRHVHATSGVRAPHMRRNAARGTFFTVADHQWACVFDELQGRELGVFELTPDHLAQLGRYLAQVHHVLRRARLRRKNPYGVPRMLQWMERIGRDLPAPLPIDVDRVLQPVLRARRRRLLPRGVIHGDLFINNTKWQKNQLSAVFDWEMAGTDHLLLDVAIVLCAWCWVRPQGETEGSFRDDLVRALLDAYQQVRPFSAQEKRSFANELRLATLRFTVSRIHDFELPREGDVERVHLPYEDFWARTQWVLGKWDADLATRWLGESGARRASASGMLQP